MEKPEYKGAWWLPEKPSARVQGTLRLSENRGAVLDLNGTLSGDNAFRTDIVLGLSAHGKKITLYKCVQTTYSDIQGSSLDISTVFVGAHFAKPEDIELDSTISAEVTDALIRIWKDSREKTARIEETFKGPHKFISEAGKPAILLGPQGILAFRKLLTLLDRHPVIGNIFSRREIERRIQSLAIDLHNTEPSDIEQHANSCAEKMLKELESSTPVNWTIFLPVEDLKLDAELKLGRVSSKMFDDQVKETLVQGSAAIIEQSKSPPEVKREVEQLFVDTLTQNYAGRAVLQVQTRAVDQDRAIESAIDEAETILNVLRFYSRGVIPQDVRAYKMFIGLKGTVSSGRLLAIGFGEPKEFVQSFQNTGYLHTLEVGQEERSRMERDSFKTLHGILSREADQRTAFERLVINSVNLFGGAMNNQNTVSAFVSIVVALESILLKKGEPMKTLLAERVALLLGRDHQECMFWFEEMSRLYQVRSDIVHRGLLDVTEADLALLSVIAYRVLVRLIADSGKLNDVGKLVDMFNELKFRGPEPKSES